MYQCTFISCNKCTPLGWCVQSGRMSRCGRGRLFMCRGRRLLTTLYFLLNPAVDLKFLFLSKNIKKKKVMGQLNLSIFINKIIASIEVPHSRLLLIPHRPKSGSHDYLVPRLHRSDYFYLFIYFSEVLFPQFC